MTSILDIFFPLSIADPLRWRRYSEADAHSYTQGECAATPDVEAQRVVWRMHDEIRVYLPGEWVSVWRIVLPKVGRQRVQDILPALLEEDLQQDIDELHFALLAQEEDTATVAVVHRQHMQRVADWLQVNEITQATVMPDWMSLPCGELMFHAGRCLARIDADQGWSCGMALAPDMLRAQLAEYPQLSSLRVNGETPAHVAAWLGEAANRLILNASSANLEYGIPQGNLLTGEWRPRVSYRQYWARWRVLALPLLLVLGGLTLERAVALWSIDARVAQSRAVAERQFLTLFPEQRRIVNLRAQVNTALSRVPTSSASDDLLLQLALIAKHRAEGAVSQVEVRGLTFDRPHQTIQLQLRAPDFARFEALRSALATDFVVQQEALQKAQAFVTGNLVLRRKQRGAH